MHAHVIKYMNIELSLICDIETQTAHITNLILLYKFFPCLPAEHSIN